MPLADTYLARGSATGNNSITLSSLNVTAGDLIVVLAACEGDDGTPIDLSITDANMGTLSWTEITTTGGAGYWGQVSIFYAVVASSTASGQITVTPTPGAHNVTIFAEAHKFTGHDGVRTSGNNGANLGAGTLTVTLGSSPVSSDITIGICGRIEWTGDPGAVSAGSGYTEIYNNKFTGAGTHKLIVETENRTASTGNTATWGCTGDDYYTLGVAIVVKEAAAVKTPLMMDSYRRRRSG